MIKGKWWVSSNRRVLGRTIEREEKDEATQEKKRMEVKKVK